MVKIDIFVRSEFNPEMSLGNCPFRSVWTNNNYRARGLEGEHIKMPNAWEEDEFEQGTPKPQEFGRILD